MAQLKNTTISDSGFLRLPRGSTSQRPSGQEGLIRYNTDTNLIEAFYNNRWAPYGGIVDFAWTQSGSGESFGASGRNFYPRTNYQVSVTTTSPSDIIMLGGRISWSISDSGDEIGFGWGVSTTSGSGFSRLTANNATGRDDQSGNDGQTNATHGDSINSQMGDQYLIQDVWWIPGAVDTYYMVPAVIGSNSTGSTVYINRYANNSGGSNSWDNLVSSTVYAMVIAPGLRNY